MMKRMTHLLVDGYNLMYVLAKGPLLSLQKSRDDLIARLHRYQIQKKIRITVAFDSTYDDISLPSRDKVGDVEIVYTRSGFSADDWIRTECQKHPSKFVVVSNDQEILHSAKASRCLIMTSDEFCRKLPAAKPEVDNPFLEDKEDTGPLYPKVTTRKRGVSKKLPKRDRRRMNLLKNL